MATFDAFMPMDRRAALAGGYDLPDHTEGAALFADISGFTPLSAALTAELGARRGAEELTQKINRAFSTVIDEVHTYRGSVIGFSGDAVTCWFEGDDGRRATTTGLAMQRAIQTLGPAHTPKGTEIVIGLKVAVAAGFARRFLVGDPGVRQIEVLAGSILDRTGAGEQLAVQGEVIISQEVRQNLGADLHIRGEKKAAEGAVYFLISALDHPAAADPWPDIDPIPPEIAKRWILPPISQRLEMGKGQYVSDLRLATAVFLQFSGINYDIDPQAGRKLNDFVCWVQGILDHYGGVLEHVTLGDKGSYLFVIFGAPVAHEDDPERALAAALKLRELPPNLDFISKIQIGINQGRVHAGTYGGIQRVTYGIQGEATNIAARLMANAAPGKIMTAAHLAAVAGKDFQFQAQESIKVKGIAAPLPVVYLQGRRLDSELETGLPAAAGEIIGRIDEREKVDFALQELAGGQNRILVIEGEAGIGKSILVADLKAEAWHLGIPTFEGAGVAVEQTSPYFAWRPIMQAVLELQSGPDADSQAKGEKVIAQLEAAAADLVPIAPLLNTILPLDLAENDLTRAMNGEDRANNLHRLVAAVLAARASSVPLLLVLEDAHWLDSSSWGLARTVAREVSPLLLVFAARPTSSPDSELAYFKQQPVGEVVALEVLDPDTILAVVGRRLGAAEVPEPVARLIQEKAEGNPFFSEELAFALRDTGHIKIENGRVEMITSAEELNRLTFPDTIQGVITSRIDGVSSRQQLLLKVASVIGRIFAYKILSDINPVETSAADLKSDIDALEKLEITPLETPEPDLTYIFRHIITQEVVYELLTFNQRRQLHRVTAEWYETHQAQDLSAVYPLLAHHWTVAEVAEKAVDYSLKAGGQELENGAFREAIKHLTDGLQLNDQARIITDPVELAEWNYRLGTAHRQIGQLDASLGYLTTALDLLGKPFPEGNLRLQASLMGQLSKQIMHRLSPGFFDGRAKPAEHPLLLARIYEGLQHVLFYQDKTIASVYAIMRHLNLGEEAPPSAQRARSYGAMVNVAGVMGMHKQAQSYVNLADEALQMDVTLSDRGLVLQYLSIYYAGAARWAENEAGCLEAIAIADTIGNRRRRQENLSCLALALFSQGDLERSVPMRREVLEAAEKVDDRQIQIWGWLEFAEVALLRGQNQEATGYLAQAEGIEGGRGLTEEIWLYGLLGVTQLRLGNLTEAQTAVDQAQAAIARSTPGAFYLLEALSGMSEVNHALWQAFPENNDYKQRLKKNVGMLKQFARSFPFSKPRSLLWTGTFAHLNGSAEKATKTWLEGLAGARDLQMPYDEALILGQLAEHGLAAPDQKESYRTAAQAIMAKLGAAAD